MRFPAHLKASVGFLYIFDSNKGKYQSIGTSFTTVVVEGTHAFVYLVTCKHVVEPCLQDVEPVPIFLRLNREDRLDVEYVPLPSEWVLHSDKSVDLAVLPIRISNTNFANLEFGAFVFGENLLSSAKMVEGKNRLEEGDQIMFIGLFEQYEGKQRNFPIVRNGHVALIPSEPVLSKYGYSEYIFIEAQIYPGNSGSPVWVILKRGEDFVLHLMGVAQGYYDEEERKWIDPYTMAYFTHRGISLVVPDTKLKEIIYGSELMKAREQKIEAWEWESGDTPKPASTLQAGEGISREDFFNILKRVSRSDQPPPDEEKSET